MRLARNWLVHQTMKGLSWVLPCGAIFLHAHCLEDSKDREANTSEGCNCPGTSFGPDNFLRNEVRDTLGVGII
jgi:hypothetical protein